jgi:alkylation response protein AidB-like acyl-CoA dehydrogenase
MLKICGTEVQQRILELTLEAVGQYGQLLVEDGAPEGSNEPPQVPDAARHAARAYFNYRKTSIYSGSNEIQKNIIAKAVLGL